MARVTNKAIQKAQLMVQKFQQADKVQTEQEKLRRIKSELAAMGRRR